MKKTNNKKNKSQLTTAGIAAVLLIAAAAAVLWKNGVFTQNAAQGAAQDAAVVEDRFIIQTADVGETASFYPVVVDGTQMEILAIRDESGRIRTAFNTCQSCYTSGNGRYAADGTELICQNCGFHFTAEQVGVETGGGCNPWPILDGDKTETADTIEISYDFLAASKDIFAHWSR